MFAPGLHAAERERLCNALAVPSDAWITVYPGNIHPANYEDMFSLYAAIHAINARGHKAHLIRTGVDSVGPIEPRFAKLAGRYMTNLGFVHRNWLIDLFKLADFFVQPGGPDDFNSYRRPSKLPELLAMGRPVVLPRTNIGLLMHHRINALPMQRGDAAEITECVELLLTDAGLAARVGQEGRLFAIEHFNVARSNSKAFTGRCYDTDDIGGRCLENPEVTREHEVGRADISRTRSRAMDRPERCLTKSCCAGKAGKICNARLELFRPQTFQTPRLRHVDAGGR